jgi:hypothetical protein
VLLAALLAGAAFAQDLEVGGIVRPELAVDTAVPDSTLENFAELHTWVRVWARGTFERGDKWFIEGRFQHHGLATMVQAEGLEKDLLVEGWYDLGLGETGWDGKIAGPVDLRIGSLVERWGKLDLLPVADVLNPRDYRSGPLIPQTFSRIPVPLLTVSAGSDHFRSETTLIPFAGADRFWMRESDWSYLKRGMIDDALAEMHGWEFSSEPGVADPGIKDLIDILRASFDETSPQMRRKLDEVVNGKDLPEAIVVNGDIGQRFELTGSAGDLAIMGAYMHSRQPMAVLDPFLQDILRTELLPGEDDIPTLQEAVAGGPLDTTWPRTWVAGADGSTVLGPLTLRSDVLWRSHNVVRQSYGAATTTPTLSAGVGFDYIRGAQFGATVETKYVRLLEPPDDLLFVEPDQVQVALGFRLGLFSERVFVHFFGAADLTFMELVARPNVTWRVGNHVMLEAGGLFLAGETDEPEDVFQSLVYQGSLGSYFSGNDCVTFAVSFIR